MEIKVGKEIANTTKEQDDALAARGITEADLLSYVTNRILWETERASSKARTEKINILTKLDDATLDIIVEPYKPKPVEPPFPYPIPGP